MAEQRSTTLPEVGPDPCAVRELVAADGARVTFCTHGGHVRGWTPAGGQERLWLSRDTGCGAGVAIRGGIPVIWPQFAERGDGPRHGIVRDRAWHLLRCGVDADGAAGAELELRADTRTRALWPHVFTLVLHVRALGDTLEVRLDARNDGVESFTFTAALHTYLRVSSSAATTVAGLTGAVLEQNDGSGEGVVASTPIEAVGPVDVAVRDVADREVTVQDPGLGDLACTAEGFESRVVWNPGPGRAPGDVHEGGEREFVCVEPALLTPTTLEPGGTWTGRQVLRAG